MNRFLRISLSLLSFLLVFGWINSPRALAVANFTETSERDLPLKKSLPLYLQHRIGNVSVQGWVQDRIRVTVKKHILADSLELAQRDFKKIDLITLETAHSFEIRMGHAQGTDLVSKMKDKIGSQVQADLEIKAPYQSDLTLVLGEGKSLKITEWRGGLEISGKENTLQMSKLNLSQPILLNCLQCATEIRESKMSGHLMVGSKLTTLIDVDGRSGLSIDEGNEEVKLENCRGKMNVHSKAGRLTANRFDGTLDFQSTDGGAFIAQLSGSLNVQTRSGQVVIDADTIKDQINIDTEKSDIQVSLLPSFSGLLDLMSLRGEIVVQFPYEAQNGGLDTYGPASPGRVDAKVGTGSAAKVHAYTKQGGVRILRKAIAR